MANTAQDVLRVAASQIGYYSPDMDSKYGDWYAEHTGQAWYADKWIAWCAMFASWCMHEAGARCAGLPGAYTPTMVNAALAAGKTVDKYSARPGDVVYFDWVGGDFVDHVGIVEANFGTYIQTIEGNTSNMVARRTRSWDVVAYVVRPDYDDKPVERRVKPVKQADRSVYRMFNRWSGEHLFTLDYGEALAMFEDGWDSEGVAWTAPAGGVDVRRLYNPSLGDHHFTPDAGEAKSLESIGWVDEGPVFMSGGAVPVYRMFNKHATTGAHMLTKSTVEVEGLVKAGWTFEGVGLHAMA